MRSWETDEARTTRVLKEILNSLERDIQFTTESPEDFETKKLPTLDFQIWVQEQENPATNKKRTQEIKY